MRNRGRNRNVNRGRGSYNRRIGGHSFSSSDVVLADHSNENGKSLDDSDIPEERYFLNPSAVSRHLFCSVCQEVFDEPYRAPCGHSFCKKCITEWLKNSSTCPEDRKRLVFGQMHHDFILENLIGDYQVACPWRPLGCQHVGPLCNLKGHKGSCSFNPKALPEVLQKYSKDILKKTTTEMMQRSLAPKPVSPPVAASEPRVGTLDALMATIPDSVVEEEHQAATAAAQASVTDPPAESSNNALSDDEAEHLPEAPAVPSLRLRLYLSGNPEERSSLCNFLETTESLGSTSSEPPAKKICL